MGILFILFWIKSIKILDSDLYFDSAWIIKLFEHLLQ